jgi:hypothetical protein
MENEVDLQTKKGGVSIIQTLGFEDSGCWFLENNNIAFKLFKSQKETNILYAFVVDDEVVYIGKSVQSLFKRMYLYKNFGPSQYTNIRNHSSIKNCLDQGKTVRVYAFVQQVPMEYKGIPINLAAGLEDNLISILKPLWNMTGNH